MLLSYLWVFLLTAVAVAVITPGVLLFARKVGAIDRPSDEQGGSTTWGASASLTRSGTSQGRFRRQNGSTCACIPITQSASSLT